MPIKSYNPTTKSRRYISVIDYSELSRETPEKRLTKGKTSTGGRNNYGRITTRFPCIFCSTDLYSRYCSSSDGLSSRPR